ncbi:MAG: cation:proton antiporter [Deltaproteobacteria bacterium]
MELRDIVVLLAASIPIVFACHRVGIPSLVGFLLAGILLGPGGLSVIADAAFINSLGHLGAVLLLFVIGLELSVGELARLGGRVFLAGFAQILLMGGLAVGVAFAFGWTLNPALMIAFVLVHSSTVVALKLFADRGQLDAPQGRVATGILVLQDLAVVPMVLLIPLLAEGGTIQPAAIAFELGKSLVLVVGIVVLARLVLPVLLRQTAKLGVRELFTVTVVVVCLGTAWLAGSFHLSLEIGALIAGLVLSDSEYSHQVFAEMAAMRDLFASLFFISIGMHLSYEFLLSHALEVLLGAAALMILKTLIFTLLLLPVLHSVRLALVLGVGLSQLGELAIVLLGIAAPHGILSPETHEMLIGISVVTFGVSPLLLGPAERFGLWWQRREGKALASFDADKEISGHVVILGYGLNGRNLARVLRETGVPFRVAAMNPVRIAEARARGEEIVYGDATSREVLERLGVPQAAIVVIAISDSVATQRATGLVRELNPQSVLIVRTRTVAEIERLRELGADDVIPEEFETSVEIFARVLRRLHLPRNVIDLQVSLIRRDGYEMLRGLELPRQSLRDVQHLLAAALTETYLLEPGSAAVACAIRDLRLRHETGVTIIAVVRDGHSTANPGVSFVLEAGDILVLLGNHAALEKAYERLAPPPLTEADTATPA